MEWHPLPLRVNDHILSLISCFYEKITNPNLGTHIIPYDIPIVVLTNSVICTINTRM